MGGPAIEIRHVSKKYRLYAHPRQRFLEALWRGRRVYHQDFWALRDICLDIERGRTVGVIGENGSGKSTLLQLIAGIVTPTEGTVRVAGRVSAILELGAGFNPEFSGRENVLMSGGLAGIPRREMEARLPMIAAFAEIGEFMDRPVKTYSSGMFVRLAFATAIHVDPDVLLVDEALAVGDTIFQHRCIRRIKEFQRQGKTIVFVSHDTNAIKSVCDLGVFLRHGEVAKISDPEDVVNHYLSYIASKEAQSEGSRYAVATPPVPAGPRSALPPGSLFRPDPELGRRAGLFRHGTGEGVIMNVELLNSSGATCPSVTLGDQATIRVHVEFHAEVESPILGFLLRDRNGVDVLGINTWAENAPLGRRRAGERVVVDFTTHLPFKPGTYSISPALAYSPHTPKYLDWVDNALVLEILAPAGSMPVYGVAYLPTAITIHDASPAD